MFKLRHLFLNSTALLLAPPNEGGNGDQGGDDQNQQSTSQNGDQGGDDQNQQGSGEEGDGDVEAGDDDSDEPEAAGDVEAGDDDSDDEDDLEDLPPEVKARVQKRLQKEVGWRDRQIDRLYRKSREAQEDAAALETIAQRGATGSEPTAKMPSTPAEVQAAAQQLRAKERYDEGCNNADATGRDVYGERWGKALSRLPKMGGVDINDMTNIIATDAPHVVLFELSKPDVYERVMALPPARRLNEFVKLSLKDAPKRQAKAPESKRPSDAPAPVTPIQGGRRVAAKQVNLYDDKAADDAWYAARNATRRKKFSSAD